VLLWYNEYHAMKEAMENCWMGLGNQNLIIFGDR